jgi:HEAT repeat protein
LSNLVDRRLDFVERVRILSSGCLTEVKDPKDLATLATLLADPTEDEVVRHEIVNLLNRSGDPALETRLFQILDNPAEGQKFRAWAVQHLGGLLTTPGRIPVSADLRSRVRQLLTDRDLHVRREALLALSRANDPQTLAQIPGLLKDLAPGADGMRDLAIRIAQAQNLRDQIPQIRPYLTATNDTLRVAALNTLGKWQDQESRPAIETALKEGSYRVKLCAQQALKDLDTPQTAKP